MDEQIEQMRDAMLTTGISMGASEWPDDQQVAAEHLARAAHSVMAGTIAELREALDDALDFVVDVVNEARPGSIHHTNAVKCSEKAAAALAPPRHD